MLTLHHLKNSRSQRVIWLLEELGLPYEIIEHNRGMRTESVKSLLSVHPLGKAPILKDGQILLAETTAIFEYLLEAHANGKLQPAPGTEYRIKYLYWKNFSESSLMQYLVMKLVFENLVQQTPFFARPISVFISRSIDNKYLNPNMELALAHIEQHLQNNFWFAGTEFTATDILIGFVLEAVAGRIAVREAYPKINLFVDRIRSRPGYQRAIARGNWSTAEHENYWDFLKKK